MTARPVPIRRGIVRLVPSVGKKDTSWRAEWWIDGARRRTGAFDTRAGGLTTAIHVADLVNEARGDITAEEAEAQTRPASSASSQADDVPSDLGSWLDAWMDARPKQTEQGTLDNYADQIRRLDAFRSLDVRTWTDQTSQDVLDALEDVYAPSTSAKTFLRVSGALRMARNAGAMSTTPATPVGTRVSKVRRRLSDVQLDAIDDLATGDLRDVLALMLETGMRIGEVCALMPGDLDRDRGGIVVTRTVKRHGRIGDVKNGDSGEGFVSVDPSMTSDLWAMLIRRADAVRPTHYLFHRPAGNGIGRGTPSLPAQPNTLRAKWDREVRQPLVAQGILRPKARPHDFRHTAATVLLVQEGTTPHAAARRLRMSLQTLQDTYADVMPETQDQMGNAMRAWNDARAERRAEAARRRIVAVS